MKSSVVPKWVAGGIVLLTAILIFLGGMQYASRVGEISELPEWQVYRDVSHHYSLVYPMTIDTITDDGITVTFSNTVDMQGFQVAVTETKAASTAEWVKTQKELTPVAMVGQQEMSLVSYLQVVDQDGNKPLYGTVFEGVQVVDDQLFVVSWRQPTSANTLPLLDAQMMRMLGSFLVEDLQPTQAETDLHDANAALAQFLGLLHEGTYEAAGGQYGGDLSQLREWNSTINPDDVAVLWKNGCEINGLVCLLVRDQTLASQPDADTYVFSVTFVNDDGSVFSSNGQTAFPFTVTRGADGLFLVQTMPVYQQ